MACSCIRKLTCFFFSNPNKYEFPWQGKPEDEALQEQPNTNNGLGEGAGPVLEEPQELEDEAGKGSVPHQTRPLCISLSWLLNTN